MVPSRSWEEFVTCWRKTTVGCHKAFKYLFLSSQPKIAKQIEFGNKQQKKCKFSKRTTESADDSSAVNFEKSTKKLPIGSRTNNFWKKVLLLRIDHKVPNEAKKSSRGKKYCTKIYCDFEKKTKFCSENCSFQLDLSRYS